MNHSKKITPEHYTDILLNNKRLDVRINDAGYVVGDTVTLREFDGTYTGRELDVVLTYVTDFEQKEGYVVFGFELVNGFCDEFRDDLIEATVNMVEVFEKNWKERPIEVIVSWSTFDSMKRDMQSRDIVHKDGAYVIDVDGVIFKSAIERLD